MAGPNPSVLGSNAPALRECANTRKGVLCDSSGNVGSSNLECNVMLPKYNRYEAQARSLSDIPQHHSEQGTYKLKRGKRREIFIRHFTSAELLSPRYLAYRQKQRTSFVEGSTTEQVWSDELEEAFQQALRVYPKCGRKMKFFHGKQCGRNEWITDYIQNTTGILRTRKQVSSHIQVLKPFLSDNPAWMQFVTDKDNDSKTKYNEGMPSYSTTNVRDMTSPLHTSSMLSTHLQVLPPPPGILCSNVASQAPSVRKIGFEMYVLSPEHAKEEVIHSYTSMQSDIGSNPKALEDVEAWRLMYPDLASYFRQAQLDGEVILFESEFALMDNHPISGSKLGVDLFVDIANGAEYKNWEHKTRFYEKGVPVKLLDNGQPNDRHEEGIGMEGVSGALKLLEVPLTADVKLQCPFQSSWWVDLFHAMTQRRVKVAREFNRERQAVQQEEEWPARQLRGISVMQEVWATPRASRSAPQRICVFLWKFRLARNGGVAATTWRKLDIAARSDIAKSLADFSVPPVFQPPMTLDTALRYATTPQPSPLYAEHFDFDGNVFANNPGSLLPSPSSKSSSQSSTPIAEYPIFSASTLGSFPSSISNNISSLHSSQDAGFPVQDSGYPSHESTFDFHESGYISQPPSLESQNSAYSSQDCTVESQDLSCSPQDHNCCPQDSAHQTQDALYFTEHRYHHHLQFHHDPIDIEVGTSDFSGGQINLSYTETQEPLPAYNSSFATPLSANMVEHHQLQHEDDLQHEHDLQYEDNLQYDDLQHQNTSHHHHHNHHHYGEQQQEQPSAPDQWQANCQQEIWTNMDSQDMKYEEVDGFISQGQALGEGVDIAKHRHSIGEVSDMVEQGQAFGDVGDVEDGIGVEMKFP